MRRIVFVVLVAMGPGALGAEPARIPAFEDPALDAVTADRLVRFEGEGALRAYVARLDRIRAARERSWIAAAPVAQVAQASPATPCLPNEPCPEDDAASVVVTASRAAPVPSITNNQTTGVDEGDIVKAIGPFLLVLQDGRVFAVDTRAGLALADRVDVYRDRDAGTWYDEMLVQGDRVLVTAYSYEERATELSVFALDRATGRLAREGVFLMSSDDYYSGGNYATRIVGDRLVVHTPYDLDRFASGRFRPVVRRWSPEAERARAEPGRALFDARGVHRPVQRTSALVIHSISVCPLGALRPGVNLACRTTAFVGPEAAEMFVSGDDVFLWVGPGWSERPWGRDCAAADRPARRDVLPGAVFRVPVRGGAPSVVGVNGAPFDQFSMDSRGGEFRALVEWDDFRCERPEGRPPRVSLVRAPHRLFDAAFAALPASAFTPLPSPGARFVENRFADDRLVYGGLDAYGAPEPDAPTTSGRAVVVDVRAPRSARELDLAHGIIQLERVGDGVVANGYRDAGGLNVSLIALGGTPRVASSVLLPGRFESEGRSHAFNSRVEPSGEGVLGVPTVERRADGNRWAWRSESSDISFLSVSAAGTLARAGELATRKGGPHSGYSCEVSCVDWYGNSRPIFIARRVFGLMGTEIVEARMDGGRVAEARRLDLTAPPPRR